MMRALLARELRLAWRSGAEILNPLWFFLIVITLFPFGVGAAALLARCAGRGVVAALCWLNAAGDGSVVRDDWQGRFPGATGAPADTPLVAVVLVKVVCPLDDESEACTRC